MYKRQEHRIARDSGSACICTGNGVVTYVDANKIVVTEDEGEQRVYELQKFRRSNAGTCINQRPIVKHGERVERGDILADGPSMEKGELALGQKDVYKRQATSWHRLTASVCPWKKCRIRYLRRR